ncbi:hypothetical protein D3C71_1878420 [compost metagenome]
MVSVIVSNSGSSMPYEAHSSSMIRRACVSDTAIHSIFVTPAAARSAVATMSASLCDRSTPAGTYCSANSRTKPVATDS